MNIPMKSWKEAITVSFDDTGIEVDCVDVDHLSQMREQILEAQLFLTRVHLQSTEDDLEQARHHVHNSAMVIRQLKLLLREKEKHIAQLSLELELSEAERSFYSTPPKIQEEVTKNRKEGPMETELSNPIMSTSLPFSTPKKNSQEILTYQEEIQNMLPRTTCSSLVCKIGTRYRDLDHDSFSQQEDTKWCYLWPKIKKKKRDAVVVPSCIHTRREGASLSPSIRTNLFGANGEGDDEESISGDDPTTHVRRSDEGSVVHKNIPSPNNACYYTHVLAPKVFPRKRAPPRRRTLPVGVLAPLIEEETSSPHGGYSW